MSIENTNLELRARTVGPHTLPLASGKWPEGCCATKFWTLSSRMHAPGPFMPQIEWVDNDLQVSNMSLHPTEP